jgi:hypothetical protein
VRDGAGLAALLLAALAGPVRAESPGLSALLDRPGLRYLVIGETHGTEELPAFFGDLVAEISARKPVTVVLEYPQSRQRELDRYLASSGGESDRKALVATDYWTRFHDGRTSRAMVALIETLRPMHVPVVACQPDGSVGDPGGYERVMGECWKQAAQEPNALTVILVGNAHASLTPVFGDTLPAAAHLPKEETVSLDNLSAPGSAWDCLKTGCGEHPSMGSGPPQAVGIYLNADLPPELGTYDGVYSAGPHFTASPPASSAP